MNNYIIVTHIYPLFDYDIGHGLCLKVIKNPYHHEPGEPPEYKPLTGQIWPYSLALHGVDNVDWRELGKSFDVRDLVVFHSFITHNYMTYHYAENASRLDFDDDGLTFIADRGEISRTDTQVVDYTEFPIAVGTRYTATPTMEQIDYGKGFEVFSRLKEDKKSKELYDLIHLYEFAKSFEQTHRIYKNAKTKYLWAGHLFCTFCGRRYRGKRTTVYNNGIAVVYEYYECPCKDRIVSAEKCPNRSWRREELDKLLWDKVETLLSQPEVVLAGLKAVEADSAQADYFTQTLEDVEARLTELEEEQKQLLKQSLMGFPEELVIQENQKINGDRAVLLQRKAELEAKIEQAQQATVDMDNIKLVCDIVSKSLGSLTYEDKRLAIEALDIKVWINHNELIMEGSIPIPDDLSNLTVTSRCSGLGRVKVDS